MHKLQPIWLRLLIMAAVCGIFPVMLRSTDEPTLSKEQIERFLLTAKVIKNRESNKGITHTSRLTLSDGTLTHDASFQTIDEHKAEMHFASGVELNFVDSYRYNIAAFALSELIGLDDMIPVYVERKLRGQTGSLSWWLAVKMDEEERVKQKIPVPDTDAWNNQMYKIRVFDELISDSDPNLTNVLIDENWKIWRIDFTRAFRLNNDLKTPKDLVRCDRQLLEKLKALNANELAAKTKPYLTNNEVKAVMTRRDKIVAYFQKLIAEKGESEVLY
jgi:hypothetical protein